MGRARHPAPQRVTTEMTAAGGAPGEAISRRAAASRETPAGPKIRPQPRRQPESFFAMLSYQHAYHAGSFADLHKHLALYWLVRSLQGKDSGISFIDTHAGRGLYPLTAAETRKTGEYLDGVVRVWPRRDNPAVAAPLAGWLDHLGGLQDGSSLRCYPGSPWWLASLQRPQDRLTAFERHPAEYESLTGQPLPVYPGQWWLHGDGFEGLRGLLPVSTPRVCVLVDPSYELKTEYREVTKTLRHIVRKARHAVVLLWYPLLPAGRHQVMLDALRGAGIPKLWRSELCVRSPGAGHGMYGSGLLLRNPPWQLDVQLAPAFAQLASWLADDASHRSQWWTGE